jgi:hypothetical protein
LWAHDFSETSVLAYRSWPLWRGYSDVTTIHGPATGTQTVSKSVLHRGMHGDSLATTDNQAMVWDSRKASLITAVGAPGRTAAVGGTGGRCLGVAGNATGNGAATELQDCNGTPNQVWQ